ncbi:MAG: hypothetical protein DSM106950_39330 [Stigonema ocellatum SAG 48.90 = DSM 106950]|nr:hypothetical protein [Stigonema ocellatum SAG 48.90 = DSM 106950]
MMEQTPPSPLRVRQKSKVKSQNILTFEQRVIPPLPPTPHSLLPTPCVS